MTRIVGEAFIGGLVTSAMATAGGTLGTIMASINDVPAAGIAIAGFIGTVGGAMVGIYALFKRAQAEARAARRGDCEETLEAVRREVEILKDKLKLRDDNIYDLNNRISWKDKQIKDLMAEVDGLRAEVAKWEGRVSQS